MIVHGQNCAASLTDDLWGWWSFRYFTQGSPTTTSDDYHWSI